VETIERILTRTQAAADAGRSPRFFANWRHLVVDNR